MWAFNQKLKLRRTLRGFARTNLRARLGLAPQLLHPPPLQVLVVPTTLNITSSVVVIGHICHDPSLCFSSRCHVLTLAASTFNVDWSPFCIS
jgi:hypothetical protein